MALFTTGPYGSVEPISTTAETIATQHDHLNLNIHELADSGDPVAQEALAELLWGRGDLDTLIARAASGDHWAQEKVAQSLIQGNDIEGLRHRADSGEEPAQWELARFFATTGEGGLNLLAERADRGDLPAQVTLAELISEERLEERARGGDLGARRVRARRLRDTRNVISLRLLADEGDTEACDALTSWLIERGDLDGLIERINLGDESARRKMVQWQLEQGLLAFESGDFEAGKERYAVAASHGSREAMLILGVRLATEGDLGSARELFTRVLSENSTDAATLAATLALASVAEQSENYSEAKHWYSQSAFSGSTAAMLALGRIAERELDLTEAENWYTKAHSAGDAGAALSLGKLAAKESRFSKG